jgi:hypothetical protein
MREHPTKGIIMVIKLPALSILAAITDSETDMYIHPNGHLLFVNSPTDDGVIMFVVEEDLNSLSEDEVNRILQREVLAIMNVI